MPELIDVTLDPGEIPIKERPATPGWTENYCNQVYCPESRIGIWTHLSRDPGPLELWREVWVVYLPGDRFLVAKSHGAGANDQGPGGSMLSLRCEESFRRWTMCFRGAVRDVTGEQLRSGPLQDGPHVVAEMELSWEASSPVLDFGKWMADQTWATGHYEQLGQARGELALGDERWELDGMGIRDHSRGPRFYGQVREDWWLSAQFPSGKYFSMLELADHYHDGPLLRHGFVSDGTTIEKADVLGVELVEVAEHGAPRLHRIRLRTESGEHLIEGRIIQDMPFALGEPNDIILGSHPDVPLQLSEAQTEYTWDGEIGYGLTERARTVATRERAEPARGRGERR